MRSAVHTTSPSRHQGALMRTATVQLTVTGGGGAICQGFGLRIDFN
jgi:hypothetical protein